MANKADVGFTNRKKCRWQSGRRAVSGRGAGLCRYVLQTH